MKKRITHSLALLAVILSIFFFSQRKSTSEQPKHQYSGAYEALSFLSLQRTYPFEKIPDGAYFSAWEYSRQAFAIETRDNPPTAPWESMGPHNVSGRTLALVFNPQNPNTIYAGSASGGLWRSYTGGLGQLAWEQVPTGFPILGVSTIAFNPGDSSVIYIGTGEVYNHEAAGTGAAYRNTRGSYGMGILKSADGGATWSLSLDWSYEQERGIWAISVSEQDPDIVWAATTEGVYKSTDAGANWQQMNDVVLATDLLVHPQDHNTVLAAYGNFSSPGFGIYKTVDGGQNWTKITSGLPSSFKGKIQLAMAPSDPDIVYASIGNGFLVNIDGASWLCRSTDFGSTWTVQNQQDYSQWQGWFAHDVAVHPENPNELVVIGINPWRSTDAGQTLSYVGNGVHVDCHDVRYNPENGNIVYVVSDGGVFRSTDAGQNFQDANNGYQTVQFYNGFSNSYQDSTFCMGGLQDNGTIRWNGDLAWTWISGGDGSWTAIDPANDNTLYTSSQFLNIRRSVNRGQNFTNISPPDNGEEEAFIAPYVIAPDDGNRIYAGRTRVYTTVNGGQDWTLSSNPPLDGNPVLSMAISSQNAQVVYAATAPFDTGPGVFVTLNGGQSWTEASSGLPNRFPMDLAVDPTDDATAYVVFSGFGTGHVFQTSDYGNTWTDITANLPDVPTTALVVDPLFPNHLYVGNDLGVFVSVDNGGNWEPYLDGLPAAVMAFDLTISPVNRKLRVATHGNGAYQRDLLDEVTPTVEPGGELVSFDLEVFPNPIREQASLRYYLPESGRTTIQLIDGTGRVARTVFSGHQFKGEQQLQLGWQGLSSGVYYCRLVFGERAVAKMVIVQ